MTLMRRGFPTKKAKVPLPLYVPLRAHSTPAAADTARPLDLFLPIFPDRRAVSLSRQKSAFFGLYQPHTCVFNKLTPQQPEAAESRLTALFSTVAIEQPVNPLHFESFPFSRMILNTFLQSYPRLLYSILLGVTCPT
jgi:hypothetical protein